MTADRNQKPASDADIVEGEIVAEFSDHTLMNLPGVADDNAGEPAASDSQTDSDRAAARRQLLTRLALGGAAALALGGSAALLLSNQDSPNVVVLPNGARVNADGSLDTTMLLDQIKVLQTQLASAESERDQLTVSLQNANTELDRLRPLVGTSASLIDLWQQLDDVQLDSVVSDGIAPLDKTLLEINPLVTLLQSTISTSRSALAKFETDLPRAQAGFEWLEDQTAALVERTQELAASLQQVVAPGQNLSQTFANFVSWLGGQIPVSVSAKARPSLDAVQPILANVTGQLDGIRASILDALGDWFGSDQTRNLLGVLIDPIKQLLDASANLVSQLTRLDDTFHSQLLAPVNDAIARRAEIRAQIDALRGTHSTSG